MSIVCSMKILSGIILLYGVMNNAMIVHKIDISGDFSFMFVLFHLILFFFVFIHYALSMFDR